MKLDSLSGKAKQASVSVVYFGDGAASTGDFHSACNFAATLKVPVSNPFSSAANYLFTNTFL